MVAITFLSRCTNPRDVREAGLLMQEVAAVIADLHLDPLPGGLKPDTRYIYVRHELKLDERFALSRGTVSQCDISVGPNKYQLNVLLMAETRNEYIAKPNRQSRVPNEFIASMRVYVRAA